MGIQVFQPYLCCAEKSLFSMAAVTGKCIMKGSHLLASGSFYSPLPYVKELISGISFWIFILTRPFEIHFILKV